ncbi:Histidine kinase-, DNA gyrase B-, and HSP90-like ATPase [compost metagenome]
MGMSVAQLQSFNTATHQLGETTLGTNKEKGTGLGLTLCKTFAQLMDATLTARSNAPEGTIFMLVLRKTT